MTKLIFFLLLLVTAASCKKEVKVEDVFTNFTIKNTTLPADGSSSTAVSVELPVESDPAKRGVIFSAANGAIAGATQGKLLVKADFEGGKLIARANFRSSLTPGEASVTIAPELQSPYKDFKMTGPITLQPSLPGSLKLESSAPAVRVNYQNEIFLRAIVLNDDGKNVSEGVEVRYKSYFVPNQVFEGRYRNRQTITADSSSVSTFFSVGNLPVNTDFYVEARIWENGAPTDYKDAILLTIIN